MGRLSGFKYRQIIKKLKAFGFEFFVMRRGATKSGITQPPEGLLPFLTTLVICLKGRYVPS